VATSFSIITELSRRYAEALFAEAVEKKSLEELTKDVKSLEKMSQESQDFQELIKNPVISKKDKLSVVQEISKKAGFCELMFNFLSLLAENNRLFAIDDIIKRYHKLALEHAGGVNVDVICANELNKEQEKALAQNLEESLGKDIVLNKMTDPDIIGGLIIKIGSHMIDSSVKSKLKRLQLAMKGVE
jgi:F-type H+-transporting ATPase subunit delta